MSAHVGTKCNEMMSKKIIYNRKGCQHFNEYTSPGPVTTIIANIKDPLMAYRAVTPHSIIFGSNLELTRVSRSQLTFDRDIITDNVISLTVVDLTLRVIINRKVIYLV